VKIFLVSLIDSSSIIGELSAIYLSHSRGAVHRMIVSITLRCPQSQ